MRMNGQVGTKPAGLPTQRMASPLLFLSPVVPTPLLLPHGEHLCTSGRVNIASFQDSSLIVLQAVKRTLLMCSSMHANEVGTPAVCYDV